MIRRLLPATVAVAVMASSPAIALGPGAYTYTGIDPIEGTPYKGTARLERTHADGRWRLVRVIDGDNYECLGIGSDRLMAFVCDADSDPEPYLFIGRDDGGYDVKLRRNGDDVTTETYTPRTASGQRTDGQSQSAPPTSTAPGPAGSSLPGLLGAPPPAPEAVSTIRNPSISRAPTADEIQRHYPAQARAEGVEGQAVLQCNVTARGALTGCVVVSETPPNYGFGTAALAVSRLFQMRPREFNGVPVDGAQVRIPIRFVRSSN